ncbi:MAG: hypothetical protein QE271_05885 [Bacteriovoracaceae bacterium]|nr:hypothetical protein [Bacteriovoracaceae bacterium]
MQSLYQERGIFFGIVSFFGLVLSGLYIQIQWGGIHNSSRNVAQVNLEACQRREDSIVPWKRDISCVKKYTKNLREINKTFVDSIRLKNYGSLDFNKSIALPDLIKLRQELAFHTIEISKERKIESTDKDSKETSSSTYHEEEDVRTLLESILVYNQVVSSLYYLEAYDHHSDVSRRFLTTSWNDILLEVSKPFDWLALFGQQGAANKTYLKLEEHLSLIVDERFGLLAKDILQTKSKHIRFTEVLRREIEYANTNLKFDLFDSIFNPETILKCSYGPGLAYTFDVPLTKLYEKSFSEKDAVPSVSSMKFNPIFRNVYVENSLSGLDGVLVPDGIIGNKPCNQIETYNADRKLVEITLGEEQKSLVEYLALLDLTLNSTDPLAQKQHYHALVQFTALKKSLINLWAINSYTYRGATTDNSYYNFKSGDSRPHTRFEPVFVEEKVPTASSAKVRKFLSLQPRKPDFIEKFEKLGVEPSKKYWNFSDYYKYIDNNNKYQKMIGGAYDDFLKKLRAEYCIADLSAKEADKFYVFKEGQTDSIAIGNIEDYKKLFKQIFETPLGFRSEPFSNSLSYNYYHMEGPMQPMYVDKNTNTYIALVIDGVPERVKALNEFQAKVKSLFSPEIIMKAEKDYFCNYGFGTLNYDLLPDDEINPNAVAYSLVNKIASARLNAIKVVVNEFFYGDDKENDEKDETDDKNDKDGESEKDKSKDSSIVQMYKNRFPDYNKDEQKKLLKYTKSELDEHVSLFGYYLTSWVEAVFGETLNKIRNWSAYTPSIQPVGSEQYNAQEKLQGEYSPPIYNKGVEILKLLKGKLQDKNLPYKKREEKLEDVLEAYSELGGNYFKFNASKQGIDFRNEGDLSKEDSDLNRFGIRSPEILQRYIFRILQNQFLHSIGRNETDGVKIVDIDNLKKEKIANEKFNLLYLTLAFTKEGKKLFSDLFERVKFVFQREIQTKLLTPKQKSEILYFVFMDELISAYRDNSFKNHTDPLVSTKATNERMARDRADWWKDFPFKPWYQAHNDSFIKASEHAEEGFADLFTGYFSSSIPKSEEVEPDISEMFANKNIDTQSPLLIYRYLLMLLKPSAINLGANDKVNKDAYLSGIDESSVFFNKGKRDFDWKTSCLNDSGKNEIKVSEICHSSFFTIYDKYHKAYRDVLIENINSNLIAPYPILEQRAEGKNDEPIFNHFGDIWANYSSNGYIDPHEGFSDKNPEMVRQVASAYGGNSISALKANREYFDKMRSKDKKEIGGLKNELSDQDKIKQREKLEARVVAANMQIEEIDKTLKKIEESSEKKKELEKKLAKAKKEDKERLQNEIDAISQKYSGSPVRGSSPVSAKTVSYNTELQKLQIETYNQYKKNKQKLLAKENGTFFDYFDRALLAVVSAYRISNNDVIQQFAQMEEYEENSNSTPTNPNPIVKPANTSVFKKLAPMRAAIVLAPDSYRSAEQLSNIDKAIDSAYYTNGRALTNLYRGISIVVGVLFTISFVVTIASFAAGITLPATLSAILYVVEIAGFVNIQTDRIGGIFYYSVYDVPSVMKAQRSLAQIQIDDNQVRYVIKSKSGEEINLVKETTPNLPRGFALASRLNEGYSAIDSRLDHFDFDSGWDAVWLTIDMHWGLGLVARQERMFSKFIDDEVQALLPKKYQKISGERSAQPYKSLEAGGEAVTHSGTEVIEQVNHTSPLGRIVSFGKKAKSRIRNIFGKRPTVPRELKYQLIGQGRNAPTVDQLSTLADIEAKSQILSQNPYVIFRYFKSLDASVSETKVAENMNEYLANTSADKIREEWLYFINNTRKNLGQMFGISAAENAQLLNALNRSGLEVLLTKRYLKVWGLDQGTGPLSRNKPFTWKTFFKKTGNVYSINLKETAYELNKSDATLKDVYDGAEYFLSTLEEGYVRHIFMETIVPLQIRKFNLSKLRRDPSLGNVSQIFDANIDNIGMISDYGKVGILQISDLTNQRTSVNGPLLSLTALDPATRNTSYIGDIDAFYKNAYLESLKTKTNSNQHKDLTNKVDEIFEFLSHRARWRLTLKSQLAKSEISDKGLDPKNIDNFYNQYGNPHKIGQSQDWSEAFEGEPRFTVHFTKNKNEKLSWSSDFNRLADKIVSRKPTSLSDPKAGEAADQYALWPGGVRRDGAGSENFYEPISKTLYDKLMVLDYPKNQPISKKGWDLHKRALELKLHPDKNSGLESVTKKEFEEQFKVLQQYKNEISEFVDGLE